MTIKVGDKIVNEPLMIPSKEKGVDLLNLQEFSKGKKIVVFAVPAAFSPTCSRTHLPGYLENHDKLMEKGIDAIICCLLYTSPSPRDRTRSRMPSSA